MLFTRPMPGLGSAHGAPPRVFRRLALVIAALVAGFWLWNRRSPGLRSPWRPGPVGQSRSDEPDYDVSRLDGRIALTESDLATKPHPIPFLMRRARRQWADLRARQSQTFAQAVAEYRRRHGRAPPRGFDRWYAFARAKGVDLIDEYDIIFEAIERAARELYRSRSSD